jgi:hypothetical protein
MGGKIRKTTLQNSMISLAAKSSHPITKIGHKSLRWESFPEWPWLPFSASSSISLNDSHNLITKRRECELGINSE